MNSSIVLGVLDLEVVVVQLLLGDRDAELRGGDLLVDLLELLVARARSWSFQSSQRRS